MFGFLCGPAFHTRTRPLEARRFLFIPHSFPLLAIIRPTDPFFLPPDLVPLSTWWRTVHFPCFFPPFRPPLVADASRYSNAVMFRLRGGGEVLDIVLHCGVRVDRTRVDRTTE